MKKNPILLDYANCMSDYVGTRHGIQETRLKECTRMYTNARMGIISKKNTGVLGFMDLPFDEKLVSIIKKQALAVQKKFDNFVVIGIGGSALGVRVLCDALKGPFWNELPVTKRKKIPRIYILDNIDPVEIKRLCEIIDIKKTFFNVISKSGDTPECIANFSYFLNQLKLKLKKNFSQNLLITTNNTKGFFYDFAQEHKVQTLSISDNIGGRYSVLSPVGLFPAGVMGISIDKLLGGARAMAERCDTDSMMKNPAAIFSLIQHTLYHMGKPMCVIMPYANQLISFADWFRQLWAESLGKRLNADNVPVYVGPTPIKAVGVTDQHSQIQLYVEGPYDKSIVFITVENFDASIKLGSIKHYLSGASLNKLLHAEERSTRAVLTKNERPNMNIILPEISECTIGQLFFFFELAAAYMGEFLRVNAFDQPGVELSKIYTHALMGKKEFDDKKKELETFLGGEKRGRSKVQWKYSA